MKVSQVVDFTTDGNARDSIGHGTFITSVVGSVNEDCPGIAPEAEIFIFKLFTESKESYTSWFIDAFNFVLDNDIDIIEQMRWRSGSTTVQKKRQL